MSSNHQKPIADQTAQIKMHAGELDIDGLLVKRLLADQFPHLAERTITVVRSTGTVNAIYRLDRELYVRLPRVEAWAESIDREWNWLPKLAPHISLAVPKPLAQGKPTTLFPYPWAIYDWIEGASYQDDLIDDELQVARDLANFILELRSADMVGHPPRGGRDPLIGLDEATRSAIESAHGMIDSAAASAAWAQALETPPWSGQPTWIHGDLLKSNLLVKDGQLCAVIDFGGVGIGDPAADVIPAWSVLSTVGRQVFREALDVADDVWQRARGYALHQALMIIPYYPETNPDFVTMAQRTVAEILAENTE
jgi:aminoglycoside phosphotransferase (APT) family kinase protein